MPDLLDEDEYLEKLKDLFDKRIGDQYSKEILHRIYEDAQERYKENIPPGYKDAKGKDSSNAYGDVVLWYQILDYGKKHETSIVLVIDDTKEDWWRKNRDKKIIGPRPELIQEFHEKTGRQLYMYLADEFIKQAQQRLNIQIQPTTIKEAREIRQTYQKDYEITRPRFLNSRSYNIAEISDLISLTDENRRFLKEKRESLKRDLAALKNEEDNESISDISKKIDETQFSIMQTEKFLSRLHHKMMQIEEKEEMIQRHQMLLQQEKALQQDLVRNQERISQELYVLNKKIGIDTEEVDASLKMKRLLENYENK